MKKLFNLVFFSCINLILISCVYTNESLSSKTKNDKPLVLTTFTVLADMAANVAGDLLEIKSITKLGAEIHGYQPTPSDLVKASQADLIIENGLGLERWAKKFTADAGDVPKVILTSEIKPYLIEGDVYQGKPNPHAWMSPIKAIQYVDSLVEAFSELDPENSIQYEQNASQYKLKLEKLDKDLRTALKAVPAKRRVLVTCEGAFTYLAKDYGMEEAYLWPVNAESQVTPRRMLNLIQFIKDRQVPTIYCESTVSSKAQKEVARASGAKFGGTFFVDSLSGTEGPAPTLLELQRHNVRLILQGLAFEEKND